MDPFLPTPLGSSGTAHGDPPAALIPTHGDIAVGGRRRVGAEQHCPDLLERQGSEEVLGQ